MAEGAEVTSLSELDFITFLEEWATWLSQIPVSNRVIEIDALVFHRRMATLI
jgi:hypothetical protein